MPAVSGAASGDGAAAVGVCADDIAPRMSTDRGRHADMQGSEGEAWFGATTSAWSGRTSSALRRRTRADSDDLGCRAEPKGAPREPWPQGPPTGVVPIPPQHHSGAPW